MMNSKKLAIAVMTTAMTATMVSAHLPSANTARRQMGRRHSATATSTRATIVDVTKIPAWSNTLQPKDAKEVDAGFYAKHGTDPATGATLYWKASWWPETTDEPGQFADSGGTSCWALQNSKAFNDMKEYQWTGWNSGAGKWEVTKKPGTWIFEEKQIGDWGDQLDKKGPGAYIPTWRDGAEGAYTMIHDDIGAMSYAGSVEPANEVGYDHPRIRVAWGVKVDAMSSDGIDAFTKEQVDEWAMARQMVMDGHEMINHSWDHTSAAEQWDWFEGGEEISRTDPAIPPQLRGMKVASSTAGSWQKITFPIKYTRYKTGEATSAEIKEVTAEYEVSSDYKFDSVFVVNDNVNAAYEVPEVTPEILATLGDYGWIDTLRFGSGTIKPVHEVWNDAQAKNVPGLKVFCVPGWDQNSYTVNIDYAKKVMDENIYLNGTLGSTRFPEGKVTDYYCYPYDAYSKATHDALLEGNHIAARGGAKSGMPIPGDFFHPFRVDFDAFFMMDAEATKTFEDGNPHQRLSLQGLVERTYKMKGYMIREFHACADVDQWNDANDQSKGGWWGGISKSLYKTHFEYLDGLIDEHKITVYTPTDVIKYRVTANSVTGEPVLNGMNLTVPASGAADAYQAEISVIVKFAESQGDVLYANYGDGTHPRIQPRKMDSEGKAWSVSINPYVNGGVTLSTTDVVSLTDANVKMSNIAVGVSQNGISLSNLPNDVYTADIFSVTGRKIQSTDVTAVSGKAQLSTADLGAGMFILNLQKAGASVMQHKFIIK